MWSILNAFRSTGYSPEGKGINFKKYHLFADIKIFYGAKTEFLESFENFGKT